MNRVAVINVVGLTRNHIGDRTPGISRFVSAGSAVELKPAFPAVTCTAQANYMTGLDASSHGIVGNGWYNHDLAEVQFWKQPEHLIKAPRLWDHLRRDVEGFSCAKTFWWYNMYSTADYSVTPRPAYPADGRKVFDIYSWPYDIRPELKSELGDFPFPCFWGPAAGMKSPQGGPDAVSRWIADAAKWMESRYRPSLQMVYLPHLDYNLQRIGPDDPAVADDLARIDGIVSDLIGFFEKHGVEPVIVSEYGILPVDRPVHLNRLFRKEGWLTIKEELGLELIDFGASRVFAVADHQAAHVYLNDLSLRQRVVDLLRGVPGVAHIYSADTELRAAGVAHPRAGQIVVESDPDAWFTYYYWEDDSRAPDFARCVDIHRKPGYDPCELFIDPAIPLPKLRIAWKLLRKKLGFRMLMDLIPLKPELVKGSHGRSHAPDGEKPVCLFNGSGDGLSSSPQSTDVFNLIYHKVAGVPFPGHLN